MIEANASAAGALDIPAGDCRAQRIGKSADFGATVREHRFPAHVVEEAVSGRGSRMKAYSIAVENVRLREVSFDPQTDPIVRIEAGHLPHSLERSIPLRANQIRFSSRYQKAAAYQQ